MSGYQVSYNFFNEVNLSSDFSSPGNFHKLGRNWKNSTFTTNLGWTSLECFNLLHSFHFLSDLKIIQCSSLDKYLNWMCDQITPEIWCINVMPDIWNRISLRTLQYFQYSMKWLSTNFLYWRFPRESSLWSLLSRHSETVM